MLKNVLEKQDIISKNMKNSSRYRKTKNKNQMEILELKNIISEIKN